VLTREGSAYLQGSDCAACRGGDNREWRVTLSGAVLGDTYWFLSFERVMPW